MNRSRHFAILAGIGLLMLGVFKPVAAESQPIISQSPTLPTQEPTTPSGLPTQSPVNPGASGQPTPTQPQNSTSPAAEDPTAALSEAVNGMDAQVAAFKKLDNRSIQKVRVINVQTLVKGSDTETLSKALSQNKSQIQELQTTINSNEPLKKALTANNIAIEKIIAVKVSDGGTVILFYQ